MKVLSAQEIRDADAYTIANEPVASIDLMERAAGAFTKAFTGRFSPGRKINVICGTGNNGGDGLAVSRMLIEKGYSVRTFIVRKGDSASPDFNANYSRLKELAAILEIRQKSDIPAISEGEIIIDAIFGSGLTRPATDIFGEVIEAINQYGAVIVSIDIASGLPVDQPAMSETIVRPFLTISFQAPKPAFLIPENEAYVGKWEIVDIGLNRDFIERSGSRDYLTDREFIRKNLRTRTRFSHKGDYGKALIISGSHGKMGAAVLCAKACLRTGAGLLTMHVPKCGYNIIQTSIPEAMASVDNEMNIITGYPNLENYNAVAVGPGIGMQDRTVGMMGKLLENYISPLVMDADALNIISRNNYLLENIPQKSIFTPHVKEFERFAGDCNNHYERLQRQREWSVKYGIIIILKGANTSVSLPDGTMYFNSTGNPGMATGGAGDTLTGIVTGLLAQFYSPEISAVLGVYLHGLAGDIAAETKGQEGMIASDIIDCLPQAFMNLH